jgi:hypothetical protein
MATGKGAYFALDEDTAAVSPTNISSYIRRIEKGGDTERVDATVLTSTMREQEPTFETKELSLVFKWSPAAVTFIESIKADPNGLNYEYGPNGNGTGKQKISGTCNVLDAPTVPGSDPNSLTELTVVLSLVTATIGTFV